MGKQRTEGLFLTGICQFPLHKCSICVHAPQTLCGSCETAKYCKPQVWEVALNVDTPREGRKKKSPSIGIQCSFLLLVLKKQIQL